MKSLTRSKILGYLAVIFMAMVMSIGAVIAAFTDEIARTGGIILLSAIPLAILIMVCAWINYYRMIPLCLLRQKYLLYVAGCFILAMLIPICGLAIEAFIRHKYDFPDRLSDYLSPWILVDSLSTASLLMVMMGGMGIAKLYSIWKEEIIAEQIATDTYHNAIAAYRSKIRTEDILNSLSEIQQLAVINADVANLKLHTLSDTLRKELYELPKFDFRASSHATTAPQMVDFISSNKYTFLRDVCLKILIACISITAIFETPDRPNLTMQGFWAFLGMFLILCVITYGAKALCRHFLEKDKIKQFIVGCGLFIGVMTVATIVVEYYSYVHTIHNGAPSILYSVLATFSSFCTMTLYLGGVIALVILHNWLRTAKRVTMVKTSTAKIELQFLQSQINPHFLFNVLNNVGVLIYESPQMAAAMISQLAEMFHYQFSITQKDTVKLKEELAFLNNYLLLEQSRKSPFEFMVRVEEGIDDIEIPSLLLIPFVENASKHSCGTRNISIRVDVVNTMMEFSCSNIFNPHQKIGKEFGGLGLTNTRRRLDLIYGDDYKLDISTEMNKYIVKLSIPIKKNEMSDCR